MKKQIFIILICFITFDAFSQDNICGKGFKSKKEIDFVKKNAYKIIISNNDDCVVDMIDSITNNFIQSSKLFYIEAMDSIYKVSDGYVTEALIYNYEVIFQKNFNAFFNYVYINRENKTANIKGYFIMSGSIVLSEAKNKVEKRKEMKEYMMQIAKKNNYSIDKINYLIELEKQFDEKGLD